MKAKKPRRRNAGLLSSEHLNPMQVILQFAAIVGCFATALGQAQQIEKPDFFKTLVNPECSHCVDEAKRRGSELREDDRMLAWIRGKYDGGAVPFRFFLVPYRVISDTYGVWVHDADAGFVRGYEPSLDFSFHGWRNGIMVIKHKDGTLFSALSGLAFGGPRKGTALKVLPTLETDWGYWLKAYPRTVAYNLFEKYVPQDLPTSVNLEALSTRLPADARLKADEPVIGIAIGNKAKAYPISLLSSKTVIRDTIGDQELAVLWYAPTKTAAIYAPRMENETTPERLKLEHKAQIPGAPFMDHETFSHWTIEGRAVEGPLKGNALAWLPGVQCKWFAWAAEYPATEIYSASAKSAEVAEPNTAKLIEGERLDWDKLVKTTGYVVAHDSARKSFTIFTDHDQKQHPLSWTPHTEFHVDGAWGDATDFAPDQSVFVIAMTDDKKEVVAVHALVDDISMQSMSRPYILKEYDRSSGRIAFTDEKERKAPIDLKVTEKTQFLTEHGDALRTGSAYYCNMRRSGSGQVAIELLDAPALETRRGQRRRKQRDDLANVGLTATISEYDPAAHRVTAMVRRADAWFARFLKVNDLVDFKSNEIETASAKVTESHPDYSRQRIRLEMTDPALTKLRVGDVVFLFTKLPDKVDFETPPDLGRFTGRQERIDYLLSTLYCPCGMLGTSCAGHWNTLAACKLHGCGMPNLFSKMIGEMIDAGKSDESVLSALFQKHGRRLLNVHQN